MAAALHRDGRRRRSAGYRCASREADRTTAEIGYSVVRAYRGRGIATEAVAALIDEGFTRARLREIRAYCLPENVSSRAVLQRNGFEDDGTLPRGATVQGRPVDVIAHTLEREQWAKASARVWRPLDRNARLVEAGVAPRQHAARYASTVRARRRRRCARAPRQRHPLGRDDVIAARVMPSGARVVDRRNGHIRHDRNVAFKKCCVAVVALADVGKLARLHARMPVSSRNSRTTVSTSSSPGCCRPPGRFHSG